MATSSEDNLFGDDSLFDEFCDVPRVNVHKRSEKDDFEKKLKLLKKENEELKRRLRLLAPPRPGNLTSDADGPIAHVVFMHHDVINKQRQRIDDFMQYTIFQGGSPEGMKDTIDDVMMLPQRSAVSIAGDQKTNPDTKFLATGSVQYYLKFCMDMLGRPLVDGNPQLTEGWDIPLFESEFQEALPVEEGEGFKPQGPPKRKKNVCWNCGEEGHALRDCKQELNQMRINEAKRQFQQQSSQAPASLSSSTFHKGSNTNSKYSHFKAGVISDALQGALGIDNTRLPPYIYIMRMLGYPPGHLKDAEVESSGLAVYDLKQDEDGEVKDTHDTNVTYDPQKLIDYPGFNVPVPEGKRDECEENGMPPMQQEHKKEVFEMYLTPQNKKRKRGAFNESEDRKKQRVTPQAEDMDVEASPMHEPSRGFWIDSEDSIGSPFVPPLPPTPQMPPLPSSTPPATPDRTPLRLPDLGVQSMDNTPSASVENTPVPSPSVSSQDGIIVASDREEESPRSPSPSLQDLEVQQQKLRNALLANATPSEGSIASEGSKIVIDGEEYNIESIEGDIGTEAEIISNDLTESDLAGDAGTEDENEMVKERTYGQSTNGNADPLPVASDNISNNQENENFKDSICNSYSQPTENDKNGNSTNESENADHESRDVCDDNSQTGSETSELENTQPVEEETPNKSGVPHRLKFARGITPHVDENVSVSKGLFKKLLTILKTSKN